MKSKIFTFFTFLLFSAVGISQPLPGSPLPDTITFKNTYVSGIYENYQQNIYQYHSDGRKKIVKLFNWNSTSSSFEHSFDSVFVYLPNNKLSKIATNDEEITYKYNSRGQDSLIEILRLPSNTLKEKTTFEYTLDGKLSKIKQELGDNYYIREYFYDENGNQYFYKYTELDNGIVEYTAHENSYFLNNKITGFTFKHAFGQDTTNFVWVSKYEWTYYQNNELDTEIGYLFDTSLNNWVLSFKRKYTYEENVHKEFFGLDLDNPTKIRTIIFNSKKQEIDFISESYNEEINKFKVTFRIVRDYRNDGALLRSDFYYESNSDPNSTLQLEDSEIYGYITPDISSSHDLAVSDISIYPNPSSDAIQIEDLESRIQNINMIDINGKIIQKILPNDHSYSLRRNGLPTGMYYLQIQTEKAVITRPIIWQD